MSGVRPPSSADRIRSLLVGTDPTLAGLVVLAVGLVIGASYAIIGFLELNATESPGTTVLLLGFWAGPTLAGIVCGRYRLGLLAALGSGTTPIVVLYALQLVTRPDGDLPKSVFALMLGGQSVPFAIGGFVLGAVAALRLR